MGGDRADVMGPGSGVPTNPEAPRQPDADPSELQPGSVLAGRYEVRSLIGAGGMGTVYRVIDRELHEDVALKILRRRHLDHSGSLERFRREVRLARRIGHPNVCRMFDLGEVDGLRFLTMEWVEGRSLRAELHQNRPGGARAVGIFAQIVSGVAAAHELGIVHRDIKPENVLIRSDGRVKVADFGLAFATAHEVTTALGAGTPAYMSPEQLRGERLGPPSDVFALGILGTELLTGRSPFGEGSAAMITSAILRDPPAPFVAADLDPDVAAPLAELLRRALEKLPEARFADAGQLADAMAASLPGSLVDHAGPSSSRRPPPLAPFSERPLPPAAPELRPAVRPASRTRVWVAAAVVVGAAVAALTLGGSAWMGGPRAPGPGFPAEATEQSGPVAAAPPEASVQVLDFEDNANEPDWHGLAAAAREKSREALRNVEGVRVLGAEAAPGEPVWVVRGSLQKLGNVARLAVWFEREGRQVGETVEADAPGVESASLLESLRGGLIDEVRLLVRDRRRRDHARRETASARARDSLLAYYDLLKLSSRPDDLDAGIRIVQTALRHDPAYPAAKLEYAELLAQRASRKGSRADLDDALSLVDSLLADAPADPRALSQQCRYRRFSSIFEPAVSDATLDAARSSCERALAAHPDSAAVLLALAKLAAERCDDAAQVAHLNRVLAADRSRMAEVLPLLATLASQGDQPELAFRLSEELVALQLHEESLGPRALSRRAGVDPAQGAFLLRGGVLLRAGRVEEAHAAFNEELKRFREGPGAAESAAAALYGLARVAVASGEPVPADVSARLREIEARPLEAAEIEGFVGEIAKASPKDALTWLARLSSPRSCNEAIQRAQLHASLGDRAVASRSLALCERPSRSESECLAVLRRRLSR